jgi:deoxyhypusine synthase
MSIKQFMKHNFRHFNAAVCVDAAEAYIDQLKRGNKMMITLAGAMSTAELGVTLAEMIRRDKVHAISCTGANLEEDIFNAVAHNFYERVPHYRQLSTEDEIALYDRGMNRVTDTCIPEDEAFRAIEKPLLKLWQKADKEGASYFPYEFMYQLLDDPGVRKSFQIQEKDSWVLAAKEKNIPIFSPGWEDSTLANIFVSHVVTKDVSRYSVMRSGVEQMGHLIEWYLETTGSSPIGFFQIGGGIAGDFPICVVPLIHQDLQQPCPKWSYFCQISDSTTSFGSYSGAVPNEKITWGKLTGDTPRFVIESDASIVAPLIFSYILES